MSESVRCWNCGQPLRVGTQQCLWCGVAQQQVRPTQFVVAPPGFGGAPAQAPAGADQPPATPQAPAQQSFAQQAPTTRAAARQTIALDPAFAGTAASPAAQVASFTIDVLVVSLVAVAVYLVTSEPLLAVIALVQVIVGLWVLEARTGATVGNAILRLRASREDAPFSPGVGRSFVRRLITGVGFLGLAAGAWVVVASGSWDRSRRNRGWADAAARTLVVAVPRAARVSAAAGGPAQGMGAAASGTLSQEAPLVLAAPQVVSTLARANAVDEDSMSQSQTGAPSTGFAAGAPGTGPAAAPPQHARPADAAAPAIAPPSVGVPESTDGTILLVFDTGQREQFATPVAVNLGRNPAPTEPTDMLVTVTDPESTVSKTHLRLEHSRGRTWVTDGGSTNGTELLDDEGEISPLAPGNRVLLEEGVRVRIGNRAFTVSLMLGGEK